MSKPVTFLTAEISDKVDKYVNLGITLNPSIIANEICQDHAHKIVDDDEFIRVCVYGYVRQNVGKYLLKRFDNPDRQAETNQIVIEGFEYLQTHYIVEIEGEKVAEHISILSEDQLLTIEDRMTKNINGLTKHRNELKRFREKKFK